MKRLFLFATVISVIFTKHSFAQDNKKTDPSNELFSSYIQLKNALVAGDANNAKTAAFAFVQIANGIDYKLISEGNISKLSVDAGKISETTDIKKQRQYFGHLSKNMADVARSVRLTEQPVYYAYCPMRKAYWLSDEKAIKNPYYGNAMLTCGQVVDTIQ